MTSPSETPLDLDGGQEVARAIKDALSAEAMAFGRTGNQPLDLGVIEARANTATEGPWRSRLWFGRFQVVDSENEIICETDDPDDLFIAAAREDVPALVAEVERLRGENKALRSAYREIADLWATDEPRPRTVGDLTARDLGRRMRIGDEFNGPLDPALFGAIWMFDLDTPVEFLDDEPANAHQQPGERFPSHDEAELGHSDTPSHVDGNASAFRGQS